jgi:hypothetical protein
VAAAHYDKHQAGLGRMPSNVDKRSL